MIRTDRDPGGSKIEVATLDDDGVERERERIATPRGDYAATLAAIAGLVRNGVQKIGAGDTANGTNAAAKVASGIGIPGSESPIDGRVRNANSTWLNGRPLRHDFEALPDLPVVLANDANCFAFSEARDGAAAGAQA